MLFFLIVATVGFTQDTISTSERIGIAEICVAVFGGQLERDVLMHVSTFNATGKFVVAHVQEHADGVHATMSF